MNNKGVGVVYCIISAALKITQYLTIAIFAQNRFTTSWSADDIEHYMSDYFPWLHDSIRSHLAICTVDPVHLTCFQRLNVWQFVLQF